MRRQRPAGENTASRSCTTNWYGSSPVSTLRNCCTVHSAVGWSVTFQCSIRRVRCPAPGTRTRLGTWPLAPRRNRTPVSRGRRERHGWRCPCASAEPGVRRRRRAASGGTGSPPRGARREAEFLTTILPWECSVQPETARGRRIRATSWSKYRWLRGGDLNPRPLGYEPNELPDCSTPRHVVSGTDRNGERP